MDSSSSSLPQNSLSLSDSVSDQSPSLPPLDGSAVDHKLANGVNGSGSASDNEGFVSNEEDDDEEEPTRPILVYSPKGNEQADDNTSPNSAAQFSTPEAERPIAKVTIHDDDDDDDGDVVNDDEYDGDNRSVAEQGLDGGVVLEKGGGGDEKEEAGVESVKEVDTHDVVVEASAGDGVGAGVESGDLEGVGTVDNGAEEDEKIVSEDIAKSDESEKVVEVVKEGGSGDDSQEDVVVEASGSDNKGFEEGIGGLENGVKKEEDENEVVVIEDLKAGATTDQSNSLVVESGLDDKSESVAFENNGGHGDGDDNVKFTGSEDSLVDNLQVNPLRSNVAVVGDKVEVEESEIKGLEAPARGVSLDNGFGPIEQGGSEDVVDEVADGDAESGQNVDTAVEEGDAGLVQKSDIAPLEEGETETSELASQSLKAVQDDVKIEGNGDEAEAESHVEASGEGEEEKVHHGDREIDVSASDGKGEEIISGSSDGASKRYSEDSEQRTSFGEFSDEASKRYSEDSGQRTSFGEFSDDASKRYSEDSGQRTSIGEISQDERIDGQIVTDSDEEEVETDDEGDDGKELFDSATLAALLKAASGAGQDGDSITITSQDGSRLFSVERPAGLGSSLQSGKPAMRPNRPNFFAPSINRAATNSDNNLSKEEKKKLEQLQQIRINYLRLVQRLGFTTEESIAAQVLYRLTLVAGRYTGQIFSLDAARETASRLEAEGRDDFNYSINILVLGKTGVGKSATINSIFGETKTSFSAYGPATTAVTEIVGTVDGVKIRVFDTPGLKSSASEQSFNRKVLSMVKKVTKKSPPDIVLYVDRLDLQSRDLNDLPMLRTITGALGSSIWRNVIVTLTHAASAPPDGPSGSPLSYDVFVAQRSHIVQQSIGQAVGDLRLMNPSLMNPVSLVENHPSCRKNRDGQKVLPNGTTWRPMLLLLCYSMKTLSEASNLSKAQESFDHRRLFGFRTRSPPLPYLLSWLLQSRAHPKLSADQGGAADADSDIEMADLSDSDLDEEEDEYDQLPPFKPLRKSQLDKLNREQKKAYFDEYDYRVKLLQKKQWREELRRMRELKKRGNKTPVNDYGYGDEDDQENGAPAAVQVPLPDMVLPPSFDSDNPAYRYRFLEPTSQLLTRPVLDTHSWDHDCGYDGVNIEHSLAIINKFPTAVTVQVTKDKKDFSIHLDSSVAAKHGENGSTMAGFDIQNIGKQLAYIVRGETKFKTHKRNKTAAGFSVTFLGENVSTGLKVEDQIALGKRLVLVGSAGTVRCQSDSAYGANVEVRLREADFPVGQDQSSLSLSLVKWRGDLALGANFQSQFSLGRSYKMAVRAGLNNKLSGQITVRTSSTDQLQIALVALLPIAKAIYKNFWPGASENYSIY